MKLKPAISIIGSGNTAWVLSHAFQKAGYTLTGIYSRNIRTGKSLSKKLGISNFNSINDAAEADFCFICVQDRYIAEVANKINSGKAVLIHCSGSAPIEELNNSASYGVFWPVISMRSGNEQDFRNIPVCIEASSQKIKVALRVICKDLKATAVELNSAKRSGLHLAAVFANNFSNACFSAAEDVTKQNKIDFKLLLPMIFQGTSMLRDSKPAALQTGPAKRNDTKILKKQLALLKDLPEQKKVYQALTKFIGQKYS